MTNYKNIHWNEEDLLQCKQAMNIILLSYGEDELWTAIHECNFGNLNTDAVLEEIAPEFYEYLADNITL